MEDKQKVYIKGDSNRGAEVIKTLTDLGAINLNNLDGKGEYAYYYISPLGFIIGIESYEENMMSILKEFYKEIKLPEIKKWKDGTLLVKCYGSEKEYAVYSDKKAKFDDEILPYVYAYDNVYDINAICESRDFKVASVSDINDFQELLHQCGKEWDFKNKKLINWTWKWKPNNNEEYWYINDVGEICHSLYNYFLCRDNKRVTIGNCFQTKLDAFNARNKIAKILCPKMLAD